LCAGQGEVEKMGVREYSKRLLYDSLKAAVRYHKYMYYEMNAPEITDYEYDLLEKRFDKVADELGLEGSWVGSKRDEAGIIED
jgi:NAD-dependent DNA ligase